MPESHAEEVKGMLPCFVRVILCVFLSAVLLKASDPVVGTWTLDQKQSVFRPGPPPKSQTRVYRQSEAGITATVVTVASDGQATTVEYPVNNDGHARQVTGAAQIDAIEMHRVSDRKSVSTLLHAGREIARTVREVSDDGQTLTILVDSVTGGETVHNVSVYHRLSAR